MTKEELATERNEVREILEGFSEELSQSNLDKLSRVFCVINGDEKRIAELEKENAELKKQLEMSNKVYNDNLDYSHHIEEQLTKAKDLLAKWVELFKPKLEGYPITPIQEQTEQFLREIDIDNAIQKANEGLNLNKIAEEIEQDIKEQSNS